MFVSLFFVADYNFRKFQSYALILKADLVLSLALLQRVLYVSNERLYKATSFSHLLPGPPIHRAQVSTEWMK